MTAKDGSKKWEPHVKVHLGFFEMSDTFAEEVNTAGVVREVKKVQLGLDSAG